MKKTTGKIKLDSAADSMKYTAEINMGCDSTAVEFQIPLTKVLEYVRDTYECQLSALRTENKQLREALEKKP